MRGGHKCLWLFHCTGHDSGRCVVVCRHLSMVVGVVGSGSLDVDGETE